MKKDTVENSRTFIKLIRILLSICIITTLGLVTAKKYFYISSEQAFINTKLVTLRSPITGIVKFSESTIGTLLEKGQPIFEVSNPRFGNSESNAQYNNLQNLIDTVDNDVMQDMIHIQKYEADYRRFKYLKEVGGVAQRDFEEIENSLNVLRAAVENKKKQRGHLQQRFKKITRQLQLQKNSTVNAPVKSVIWAVLTKDDEHVNTNDELIQLVNPEEIWVDCFFNERFAAKLRPGMNVTIRTIGSKKSYNGEIVFIRGGSGRIMYNTAVETPPTVLSRRLVAVRIKANWPKDTFKATEFYGIGRSMTVKFSRNRTPEQ